MDGILDSVKHKIGGGEGVTYFDPDIIDAINMSFSVLNQLGVGPAEGFFIDGANAKWTDFIPNGPLLSLVKQFVWARAKLDFDPPTGSVLDALKESVREYEWRINVYADPKDYTSWGETSEED